MGHNSWQNLLEHKLSPHRHIYTGGASSLPILFGSIQQWKSCEDKLWSEGMTGQSKHYKMFPTSCEA